MIQALSHIKRLRVLILFLTMSACSSDPGTVDIALGGVNRCQDPRPQICAAMYAPVCATTSDGSQHTFASGCSACADQRVHWYVPATCD